MTKFVMVETVPTTLHKDEYVVTVPDFKEEIAANAKRAPVTKRTAVNHLRSVAMSIGDKYDLNFNAFTHVKPTLFEGRDYSSVEDLSKIVVEMFQAGYPSIFEAAIDAQIKKRPMSTKLIYFVGPWSLTTAFTKNGIDSCTLEEADVIMGRKEKKVVGKPMQKGLKPSEVPSEV